MWQQLVWFSKSQLRMRTMHLWATFSGTLVGDCWKESRNGAVHPSFIMEHHNCYSYSNGDRFYLWKNEALFVRSERMDGIGGWFSDKWCCGLNGESLEELIKVWEGFYSRILVISICLCVIWLMSLILHLIWNHSELLQSVAINFVPFSTRVVEGDLLCPVLGLEVFFSLIVWSARHLCILSQ